MRLLSRDNYYPLICKFVVENQSYLTKNDVMSYLSKLKDHIILMKLLF